MLFILILSENVYIQKKKISEITNFGVEFSLSKKNLKSFYTRQNVVHLNPQRKCLHTKEKNFRNY